MYSRLRCWLIKWRVNETPFWGLLRFMKDFPPRWRFVLHLAYRRLSGSSSGVAGLPIPIESVKIEATSVCQLRCPVCPTGDGTTRKSAVGWGHLKLADFKAFLEANPSVRHVELSNWGEMFLNPHLKEIITCAHGKGVALTAGNGVNLNTASDNVLEHLVKHGFKHLTCAIDGASEETYPVYRRGGSFEAVIENVRKMNRYKEKYRSIFPLLTWQFIVMGHNVHEIPLARKMAGELGMEFLTKLNWNPSFSPVEDRDFASRESGLEVSARGDFEQKYKEDYLTYCHQLWVAPQINWDGKLVGCNRNYWGDFGNVFETGLEECMKGERYVYAKQMLLAEKKPRDDIPCTHCQHYQKMRRPLKIWQQG